MLAADMGWKLFDFGVYSFNFNGILPKNETVKFFSWHKQSMFY